MTDAAPPTPDPVRRVEAEAALRTGWGRGAAVAAIAFVLLYALNVVFTVVQQTLGPDVAELAGRPVDVPRVSLADVPQGALATLFLWHGATFRVGGLLPAGSPVGVGISVSFGLILGTFAVVGALYLAGRHLGRSHPAPWWLQPLRALQIAVPYSVLALFLSPLARLAQSVPGIPAGGGGGPVVTPSPLSILLMTFVLSAVAAGAGAVGTAADVAGPTVRRAIAALAGGWRMLWLATSLAVLGFLVVAALHPDQTRAYLEVVSTGGVLGILRGAILTMFLLGNVGVYVAAAAAGAGIGFTALGGSCTLLSYLQFPRGVMEPAGGGNPFGDPCAALPLEAGAAPWPYLLFLLVPAVAAVVGGRHAAAYGRVGSAGQGAAVGAAAGVPFAVLFLFFGALAGLSYEVEAFIRVSARVGPSLIPLFFLALLWGASGGALGGLLGARSARALAATTEPTPDTATGPG